MLCWFNRKAVVRSTRWLLSCRWVSVLAQSVFIVMHLAVTVISICVSLAGRDAFWLPAQEVMCCVFQKGMTHTNDSCGEQGRLVLVRENGNSLGPHPLRVTTGVCQGWHGRDRGGILKGGKTPFTNKASRSGGCRILPKGSARKGVRQCQRHRAGNAF